MNLSLLEICNMCNGKLSPQSDPDLIVKSVVIDSRKIYNKTLFVAIHGNNQDGHKFIENAIQNGAIAAIIDMDYFAQNNFPLFNYIIVNNTTTALGLFAHHYRMKFDIPVVAITGSAGKTTTTQMLKSICEDYFGIEHVLTTQNNYNNQWGVPLTLLNLNSHHKVAIIEAGMNHAGELAYLSKIINPTIAIVTTVLPIHIEFFANIDEIAQAKSEIFLGVRNNGIACINLSIPQHNILKHNINNQSIKVFEYGINGSTCYLDKILANDSFIIITPLGEVHAKLQILGKHNIDHAVNATALALNLNCNIKSIQKGIENYRGFYRRLQIKTAWNGATIVDDSYSANLDSVKVAINAINKLPKPHWLVLGDLKELGAIFSIDAHTEIAIFAFAHGIDKLLTIGEFTKITANHFLGEHLHFEDKADIVKYCIDNLPSIATILIKGSNAMNLDYVVDQLIKK